MTKYELKAKRERLIKQLNEVDSLLEKMNKSLCLDNNEKPFSKYTLRETNDLLDINEKAYNWLSENKEKSICDYNRVHPKAENVSLEK